MGQEPPQDVQLYDARGHPFNPWARAQGRQLIEAQNDILSVIGVTERKIPIDGLHNLDSGLTNEYFDPDERLAGELLGDAADFDYQLLTWWLHSMTNRLLVFSPVKDISFMNILRVHLDAMGRTDFLTAGLSSFLLSHIVNPEMWTQWAVYALDRAIFASISSKKWRDVYGRNRALISTG